MYFVSYDGDTENVDFQNTLDGHEDVESSNMIDNNAENLYSKLVENYKLYLWKADGRSFMKIFTFMEKTTNKRKNIIKSSLAQFM